MSVNPTPDVGETVTLEKGGPKTKLDAERYEKYRSEALTRIYTNVNAIIKDPNYQQAGAATRKHIIEKAIRKQRGKELKETKREMQVVN